MFAFRDMKKEWLAKINSFRQNLPKSPVYISIHYFLVTVVNSFYINKLSTEASTLLPISKMQLIDLIKADSFFGSTITFIILWILTIYVPIRTESFGESVMKDLKDVTKKKFSAQITGAKTPSEVSDILEKVKKL